MNEKGKLIIQGTVLDKYQLDKYLEKVASDHLLQNKSDKDTYPIERLNNNYQVIKEVVKLLTEHIKLGIPIHPAGEWILDNLYIIEEVVKNISKNLTIKKYRNFLGLSNGKYYGYARIYVLAGEMVAFTDGKIDEKNLTQMLESYQKKKNLNMDEIWNIGLFIQIALIENIRELSEKIFLSQIQKYKVEGILERLVDRKVEQKFKAIPLHKIELIKNQQIKYSFIEYLSYRLKKYGRRATSYLNILEEEVNKSGSTVQEIIKKEHFDIAVKKLSMGNSIVSLKKVSRINFLEIFEKLNGVEDILKQDPAGEYEKMTSDTKILYRNTIEEMSKKTKLSEIYIAKKCLELSQKSTGKREKHIGYYLVSDGKNEFINKLSNKNLKNASLSDKVYRYIGTIWAITLILSFASASMLSINLNRVFSNFEANLIISVIMFLIILLPIENIVTKVIQYILSKTVKPKYIPKLDFQNGVPEESATFVVIPTILKNRKKVQELFKKLEVFYIANKSDNLYFALLGDCTSSDKEIESFDSEIIKEGLYQCEKLNKKYPDFKYTKFNFIYRRRKWNEKEGCFLGWERKRGLLDQFNKYILGEIDNIFCANSMKNNNKGIPKIKYVITIDADTDLILNSGLELIGAMSHILNKPILNKNKDLVISGHGLIVPRVGITLENSKVSIFSEIYAGQGGTDSYTNMISDLYQDNFEEGIYTGKGIYDLSVFNTVLGNEIKENTVLSHDLLEGCYLRSGLASDIMLMDGFPKGYLSYKDRLYRWTRGDYQVLLWLKNKIENKNGHLKNNPLNFLSKYKILSNIIRSKQDAAILILILYSLILSLVTGVNIVAFLLIGVTSAILPFLLNLINLMISKKVNIVKTKTFSKNITGIKASFLRTVLNFSVIPDQSVMAIKAEMKTLYRMLKSKKNLLEWTTSEESENLIKEDLYSYCKSMVFNFVFGLIVLIGSLLFFNKNLILFVFCVIVSIIWLISPLIMWKISNKRKNKNQFKILNEEEKQYLLDIGYKTWLYFKDNINDNNNFLPPDNYQEDRKPKIVKRTSSTNIGLSLLAVISAYDLKYENLEDTIQLLDKIIATISNLQKWNGHLYNWYDLKTLEPLVPKYISSVDSGNFVGYLYVTKEFLNESKEKILNSNFKKDINKTNRSIVLERNLGSDITIEMIDTMLNIISQIINNTDFSKLYDDRNRLFSVGFNVEENKLTDSYYDLLASEARQASIIAIAKKDISSKHWNNLSRTLTTMNNYKGLISWSGTAFEYLMPNINIPKYEGSILDESCKFMIMSQKEYASRLGVPWGFSEAAFNLKDLNNNYQYKAFGIPWLGLKRGLADEIVVSSYGSILALNEDAKAVLNNIKILDELGLYGKYGFYESVDFTPTRVKRKNAVVKTYMAHHQSLILLSINNLFNDNILQKRFMKNEEMQSIKILLEEKMPENMIITKEEKEKVEKIKYVDCENYSQRVYNKIDDSSNISNVISNDDYTIVMDQYGNGYSKYKDIQINRYKQTDEEAQGIFFYMKDIKNKRIWTNTYSKYLSKPDKYSITFSPDMDKIKRIDGPIETVTKVITNTDENIEIRRLEITNIGLNEQILEITAFLEPILSTASQDYSHKAFNNLFLSFEYIEGMHVLIAKRKSHIEGESDIYIAVKLYIEDEEDTDLEFEIDKEKFFGRCNINFPKAVENSIPFSKKTDNVTDPIIAMKKIVTIPIKETKNIDFVLCVSNKRESAIKGIETFINSETINRTFELSKARTEAEMRYLGIKSKDIENYQKLLSYLLFTGKYDNTVINTNLNMIYPTSSLWKYGISGDLPIMLIKISDINDIDVVKEIISAFEFYKSKNIEIDLIILNEEKESYENYVKDSIQSIILCKGLGYLFNIKGGIFCLNNLIDKSDKKILEEKASIVIDAQYGSLEEQIKDFEEEKAEMQMQVAYEQKKGYVTENIQDNVSNNSFNEDNLKYYNEYGGFSQDGKEYLIKINNNNKLPTVWSHVLANYKFGTLVTENMGGYTWSKNSRLNRLSAWSNNQVSDVPSEIIYIKDMDSNKKWSLGLNPMPDENDYYITYGFGYAKYMHFSYGIKQLLEVFVPCNESIKINILHLENTRLESKNLKIVYYIKPVLGEDEIKSNGKISLEFNQKSNVILAKNLSNDDISEKIFVSSSEKIKSYTGDKKSFLKQSNISNPDGLDQIELNRENSYGKDSIIAISFEVKLEAMSSKDISIVFGAEENSIKCLDLAYKYSNIKNCKEELINVKKYWEDLLSVVQVNTPVESINILLNGWVMYQTIASRLWGKTGYYQSGGAIGFRDQLQDSMGIKYLSSQIAKEQIIKHCKHQFIEGDVEHWWHEETSKGIRTKFSDDLLWLPYVIADYINFTEDFSILNEKVSYKKGKILKEYENEKYDLYKNSNIKESVYNHCVKAIERSLDFGKNGLPKIGSGDWNDSFSLVGVKGIGESVWLGFFLYAVLKSFIPLCRKMNDETRALCYEEIMKKLKKNLNTNGWDGRWFKRAFTDNGEILGSIQNEECRIDSISQSWSVISGAGDNDKKFISMESLENHLVDKEDGIIKLLDPPFEKSKLEPGYIKSYIPGTRENGGQYTHGAIWVIIAESILESNEKAFDYFRMINPIEHSRTREAANKYKVEPYVVAADIYGAGNLAGRGGWTWYTGSSSWFYIAGIKYILGLYIDNNKLSINPHVPLSWKGYEIQYKFGKSLYNIKVTRKTQNLNNENIKIFCNENEIKDGKINLDESGKIYNINVIL